MYKIFHLKGVRDVHDKSNLYRISSGLQFCLLDLSLRIVGLDAFLEKSLKGVDIFSQAIDKEEYI